PLDRLAVSISLYQWQTPRPRAADGSREARSLRRRRRGGLQTRADHHLPPPVALGFIGGFYAAQYRGVAYSIFDFQTVLLGLAMITIGGIGRAEGAVLGTLVVVFLGDVFLELGPWRYLIIGAAMLGVVLFLNNGYFGIRRQFNAWRAKKRGEWRSGRTEKGGEALPEEATEINDKDTLYFRRFDKMQRDYLKELIRPEIIEEHRRQPLGQHSEALERVLLYFRRAKMEDKYALHRA